MNSENIKPNNFMNLNAFRSGHRDRVSIDVSNPEDDPTIKEDYQIAICQNGKFAVTFDTANLRIKILENTETETINKTIAHFEITPTNFMISKFYDTSVREGGNVPVISSNSKGSSSEITPENNEITFKWSFDISNIYKNQHNDGEYFIFIAVSHIDLVNDMKRTGDNTKDKYKSAKVAKTEINKKVNPTTPSPSELEKGIKKSARIGGLDVKGTAIYRLRLKKKDNGDYDHDHVIHYYTDKVSGICRFVNNDSEQDGQKNILKRFLILNFYGIYNFEYDDYFDNFKLNDRFNYPTSVENELVHWYRETHCTNKLITCLYNQYFLVEQYKNNAQALEVYDLVDMKLKIATKRIERNDKYLREYDNQNTFSVSNRQLCFTRGIDSIKLYFMENGLETGFKKFKKIDRIHLLEFIDNDEKLLIIGTKGRKSKLKLIIWDPYNTGKVETSTLDDFLTVKNLGTRLARTSGNLLQVDDNGNVTSVLKRIENELEQRQSNTNIFLNIKLCERKDNNHIIHFNNNNQNFKPIVDEKEPWVRDNYERISYCLYQNKKGTETKTLQLIVGRSTVQIWHQIQDDNKEKDGLPNKGQPFLEYIWTNGIPVNQERKETRLRIEEFKYRSDDEGDISFYLKVFWFERPISKERKIKNEEDEEKLKEEENEEIEELEEAKNKKPNKVIIKEKEIKISIQQKGINEKINAVRYAFEALHHLNKRRKFLANNYFKEHRYKTMVMYIEHIVWRFVKYQPEEYRLLDVRHNVMKHLILGDCNHLIKFILFGDKETKTTVSFGDEEKKEEARIRRIHVPKSFKTWSRKNSIKDEEVDEIGSKIFQNQSSHEELENSMELAICHCKGRELKNSIIVAYLLEYYSRHATDYAGWMSTVSKALPLLYKYHYDDYTKKLFRKECFIDQEHFSAQDPFEIIPEQYQASREFNVFKEPKLRSDKEYNLKKNIAYEFFEDFLRCLRKVEDQRVPPIILRVVPLPNFIVNNIPPNEVEYHFVVKVLLFLFVPRWYKVGRNENHLLSPFSGAVQYENNDDMYDNPATEAVIDFCWLRARPFFFYLFLRFLIFAICFILVSWAYLSHGTIINGHFLVVLFVIFYCLAVYLFITELIQLHHKGLRKYLSIFNIFDMLSIIISVITMSIMLKDFQLSDGFGSAESSGSGLIWGISVSIFILWIEMILHLRIISYIAVYIYYVIIIFQTVFPFLLFTVVVVIAFAHAMFVLLKDPKHSGISIKNNTYSGIVNSTNEIFDIKLQSDFNPTDYNDNPFSSIPTAIEAAFYWLSGNMVQRDHFDFWAIDVFTFIASIVLAIILQNLLIAFMSGVYDDVATKGRQALLRYRANKIADHEELYHIHFRPKEPQPKYVYYVGEWYKSIRTYDKVAIYKDFEERSTVTKHHFRESDYDKFSIWQYDVAVPEGGKDQKAIEKEIQEIKKMNDNLNTMIKILFDDRNQECSSPLSPL